jgi:hypothetical protein
MKTNVPGVCVPAGLSIQFKQIIKIIGALQTTLLPPTSFMHLLKLEFMVDTVTITVA